MSQALEAVLSQAREFLGDRLSTNADLREQHSHGEDALPHVLPDAVAFVETTEEAARLLALCHTHNIPVVPFGAGTSLEGHVTPVRGGITIDLSRMTHVLEVNQADMDCRIRSIPAASAPSAACAPRAPAAPTPCATAPSARTCSA